MSNNHVLFRMPASEAGVGYSAQLSQTLSDYLLSLNKRWASNFLVAFIFS